MDSLSPEERSARNLRLEKLLRHPDLWRGESARFAWRRQPGIHSLDTGYPHINALLVQRGWPLYGLTEILQKHSGLGEWQLLSRSLCTLLEKAGYLVLVDPPAQLHLPGLQQLCLDYRRFLIIDSGSSRNFIYSVRTAAASPACLGVLCWEPRRLTYTEVRKLQLNASSNGALLIVFRHLNALEHSSPASLRLSITACQKGFAVHIHKQRGTLSPHRTHQRSSYSYRARIALPEDWQPLPPLSSPVWFSGAFPDQDVSAVSGSPDESDTPA